MQESIRAYKGYPQHPARNENTVFNLDFLDTQLSAFEYELKKRGQWGTSTGFQPDPPLIIDLGDLDDAISYLAHAIHMPRYPQQAETPRAHFSVQNWTWDLEWSEWTYTIHGSENRVFLTEWEHNIISGEWQMVWQGHRSIEGALAMLGSWEDWKWDEHWGEWYLPSVLNDGLPGEKRVYASEWKKTEEGNWVYVERSESDEGKKQPS